MDSSGESRHMNHKESELVDILNITRAEFKYLRKNLANSDKNVGPLWVREESNKPEHLRTVYWTDAGMYFLRAYLSEKASQIVIKPDTDMKVMTKAQFLDMVHKTKWVGKVVRNLYKNHMVLMVEHNSGFNVMVNCRDNQLYSKGAWVVVDTNENSHTVRGQSFKSYEKAFETCSSKGK